MVSDDHTVAQKYLSAFREVSHLHAIEWQMKCSGWGSESFFSGGGGGGGGKGQIATLKFKSSCALFVCRGCFVGCQFFFFFFFFFFFVHT